MRWLAALLIGGLPFVVLAQAPAKMSFSSASFQALNKVTARVSELSIKPSLPTSFGTIDINVKSCWTSPRDEKPEHAALIEIHEHKAGSARTEMIFSGWMFASSPTLSALEHPIYDVTLIACNK